MRCCVLSEIGKIGVGILERRVVVGNLALLLRDLFS